MAELVKSWNDGGSLSVTYDGDGDGSAVFSSSENSGSERQMEVSFVDASRNVVVVRTIRQAARDVVEEKYTRLTYIECNGQQYIDLGYIVKEDDVIECDYILTKVSASDKFLFGAVDDTYGVWHDIYSSTAYVRFGQTASKSISSAADKYRITLKKSSVTLGYTDTTLAYAGMPQVSLVLFANRNNGGAYGFGYYRCSKFKITNTNGDVMHLVPAKRDSDGVVGMLDIVSGAFYSSATDVAFVAGGEVRITEDYEIIDSVAFAKDKLFESIVIESDYQIELQWRKASASGSQYLYGVTTSPHTATVAAYLSSGGSWRWGATYASFSTNNTDDHYAVITNGSAKVDVTSKTFTAQSFTTADALAVGGYRDHTGYDTPHYTGDIYFFRIKDGDGNYLVDWLPCKRLSDSVVGFWDCVTQTFIESI